MGRAVTTAARCDGLSCSIVYRRRCSAWEWVVTRAVSRVSASRRTPMERRRRRWRIRLCSSKQVMLVAHPLARSRSHDSLEVHRLLGDDVYRARDDADHGEAANRSLTCACACVCLKAVSRASATSSMTLTTTTRTKPTRAARPRARARRRPRRPRRPRADRGSILPSNVR